MNIDELRTTRERLQLVLQRALAPTGEGFFCVAWPLHPACNNQPTGYLTQIRGWCTI